jgi:predicted acyltransferase
VSAASQTSSRILSIDAARGFVILNMILFNELASVSGIPGWMHHAPDGSNTMTYVDLGVPVFLFVVGMAIPLAFQSRRERGAPPRSTWRHVLLRSAALLQMGIWMAYLDNYDPALVGIPQAVWALCMYLGFYLLWFDHPPGRLGTAHLRGALRVLGGGLLAWLFYRYHHGMQTPSLLPTWWGILGSIGWCYLFGCILYGILKGRTGLLVIAWAILLPYWYPFTQQHKLAHPHFNIDFTLDVAVTLTGAYVGHRLFVGPGASQDTRTKVLWLLGAAAVSGLVGLAFQPSFGVSKTLVTPSFLLYGLSICLSGYVVFYLLVDVFHFTRWTVVLMPAARFPLTVYLLVEAVYAALLATGTTFLWDNFAAGMPGIARALCFTGCVTLATFGLSRLSPRFGY